MNQIIPAFDFERVFIAPWSQHFDSNIWILLMGFLVAVACGLVGNYLILRRMALVGDAISHSILPGLVIGFLVLWSFKKHGVDDLETIHAWRPLAMFLGALVAALVTVVLIEFIHKKSRIKQDAAIGITFSSLFAIGVILISVYADRVDLDQECVLYGEIAYVPLEPLLKLGGVNFGPEPVVQMAIVSVIVAILIVLFYKELLVSSFDPGLSASMGINATLVHYLLMSVLAIVVVSAFKWVGAILVIAMLILPGATASLLTMRFPTILVLTVVHAMVSTFLGMHMAIWINCSMGGAMVVCGLGLFMLAWIFSPSQGLLRRKKHLMEDPTVPQLDQDRV